MLLSRGNIGFFITKTVSKSGTAKTSMLLSRGNIRIIITRAVPKSETEKSLMLLSRGSIIHIIIKLFQNQGQRSLRCFYQEVASDISSSSHFEVKNSEVFDASIKR